MRSWVPGPWAVRASVLWLVVIFLSATAVWFVWPRSSYPAHAGAILVLNGSDEQARYAVGFDLAHAGVAPVVLFSEGATTVNEYYGPYCPRFPSVTVVCFTPKPARTVGELAFAQSYARAHGISSMVIVAGHAQTTRARLLARRCFRGRSYVVAAPERWYQASFTAAYEWGALTKALFVDTGC